MLARKSEIYRLFIFTLFVLVLTLGTSFATYDIYSKYLTLESRVDELEQRTATIERKIDTMSVEVNYSPQYSIKITTSWSIHKVEATAYAPSAGGINCSGNCDVTATGFRVQAIKNASITYCAVDPHFIPLGSILIIQGYKKPCVAVDTGGAIKGWKIDIMMDSNQEAHKWGRRTVDVIIIKPPKTEGE